MAMVKKGVRGGQGSVVDRLRRELNGKGYTLRLTTEKVDEDSVMLRLEIVDMESGESHVKVVGIGRFMDMDLAMGFHISEALVPDLMSKGMGFLANLRSVSPMSEAPKD